MLKLAIGVVIIFLVSLPELMHAEQRGRTIGVYTVVLVLGLTLGILICIDKQPTSPAVFFMDLMRWVGWEEEDA